MIEPVVKDLVVSATPEAAFRRFTAEIDTWWPKSTHSVSQERCASVHWDGPKGADIYELEEDGTRHVWGTVRVWDPGSRLVTSWHPGRGAEEAQEVELLFESVQGGTRVTLEHRGWDVLGEKAEATRSNYDGGWQGVLALMSGSFAS